ncbi:MAG: Smr/MutS family protein [Hyphomicrobiales bacterium]
MTRRGWLTEDDLRVWAEVARTTQPLRGKAALARIDAGPPMSDIDIGASPPPDAGHGANRSGRAKPRPKDAAAPPLAPLERRFVQRLRRGTAAPGAVIDLHGLRQEEARRRLFHFLHRCQAEGTKAAIIITGKGGRPDALAGERGVLRRAVPLWLVMPDLRSLVVGFQEAGAGLGGEGALIVRIRAGRRGASGAPAST